MIPGPEAEEEASTEGGEEMTKREAPKPALTRFIDDCLATDRAWEEDESESQMAELLNELLKLLGFTREHVELLQEFMESLSCLGRPWDKLRYEQASSLADLIEALLPPGGEV